MRDGTDEICRSPTKFPEALNTVNTFMSSVGLVGNAFMFLCLLVLRNRLVKKVGEGVSPFIFQLLVFTDTLHSLCEIIFLSIRTPEAARNDVHRFVPRNAIPWETTRLFHAGSNLIHVFFAFIQYSYSCRPVNTSYIKIKALVILLLSVVGPYLVTKSLFYVFALQEAHCIIVRENQPVENQTIVIFKHSVKPFPHLLFGLDVIIADILPALAYVTLTHFFVRNFNKVDVNKVEKPRDFVHNLHFTMTLIVKYIALNFIPSITTCILYIAHEDDAPSQELTRETFFFIVTLHFSTTWLVMLAIILTWFPREITQPFSPILSKDPSEKDETYDTFYHMTSTAVSNP